MSTTWVARRGTAPCPHAFPAGTATQTAVLHTVCRPCSLTLPGGCSCTWRGLATVTLDPACAESELPLVSSSLFPARCWGGQGSPLSPDAFATSPLRVCHFRKGPSVRASAPEPFAFSGFVINNSTMCVFYSTEKFKVLCKMFFLKKTTTDFWGWGKSISPAVMTCFFFSSVKRKTAWTVSFKIVYLIRQ